MARPDAAGSLFAGTSNMTRSLQLSVRGPRRRTLRGGCHGQNAARLYLRRERQSVFGEGDSEEMPYKGAA